jgi:cytochrome c oxidase subunit 2
LLADGLACGRGVGVRAVDRLPSALSLESLFPRPGRIFGLAVLTALVASLIATGVASADALTPDSQSGSPNAQDIDTLYKLLMILGGLVFLVVEGALIWSFFRFKAKRGRVAAQIHGNTRLEIGWTVAAALLLVLITAVTFIMLPGIKNPARSGPEGLQFASDPLYAYTDQPTPPGGDALTIKVDGQQYVWRFQYPGNDDVFAYEQMVVPVDTTVVLDITADDVAHSWWIPALGGKADAIPGYTNHYWFKAAKTGVYHGQCAELCGRNLANMLAEVRVLPVEEYQAWYRRQASNIQQAQKLQAEQRPQYDQPNIPDSAEGESTGGASGPDLSGETSAPQG